MKTCQLELSLSEKQLLKQHKIKIKEITYYAGDELSALLKVPAKRANEILAFAIFQQIPSIGIKFAQDLISLGYYNLAQLQHKTGPSLLNDYERMIGYRIDPCVEDQFWLVVHYANNSGSNKNWWDFTPLRKAYRTKEGYPANRPA